MLTGFYTIASGLLTRQRELDTVGSNLTNAQTPGYRASRFITSSFEMELLSRQEALNSQSFGSGVPVTTVEQVTSLYNAGTIKPTDRTLDMAIGGEGFFTVSGADGALYLTRNGQFDLDEEGYLILPGAGRVLGEGGPIEVGVGDFSVSAEGVITKGSGEELEEVDTLRLLKPQEGTALEKMDNGLFRIPNGANMDEAQGHTVYQGSLELSNVNMNQELTTLVEVQRAFQSCSSAFQIVDAMDRKAAQIASV